MAKAEPIYLNTSDFKPTSSILADLPPFVFGKRAHPKLWYQILISIESYSPITFVRVHTLISNQQDPNVNISLHVFQFPSSHGPPYF